MTQQEQVPSRDPAPVQGAIVSVKAGVVRGWIENADPNRALALLIGRRRIATTHPVADGGGTRAEFAFDAKGCPADLLARPELALQVVILGDAMNWAASARMATEALVTLDDLPAAATASLEGCIDEKTPDLVRGWVRDVARPERQLDLFLFAGERYLGKYAATLSRPDLAASGRGHGNYGFAVPLGASTDGLTVIAGDPEFWRIPLGAHAVSSAKGSRRGLRDLPGSVEAFARALTSTEPFPKKAFAIDKVKQGAVPDAFSADYVALALECLRHEMVATGEAMHGGWRSRLRTWAEMRVIGTRMRRLEDLAAAIAEGPRLLDVAAKRRRPEDG